MSSSRKEWDPWAIKAGAPPPGGGSRSSIRGGKMGKKDGFEFERGSNKAGKCAELDGRGKRSGWNCWSCIDLLFDSVLASSSSSFEEPKPIS